MTVQVSLEDAYQTALTALGAAIVREQLLVMELKRHTDELERQRDSAARRDAGQGNHTPEVTA